MNYCSELTKNRILECAKVEFLKVGFQAASLQNIVKAAKVTTGAVYRHFENKEELFFALVEEVYNYTLKIMEQVEPYDPSRIAEVLSNDSIEESYEATMAYVKYMYQHLEEFQLLLKYSAGSRVEHFTEEITERYTKQNTAFVEAVHAAGYVRHIPSETEMHILTKGFITALCECVLHDIPQEETPKYIHSLVTFQHYGWYGVLGLPLK